MKLFSFAYAGGDGHVFYEMSQKLKSTNIEIVPFYYKGRGCRQEEQHYESIMEIAREAADFIKSHGVTGDYALLGHSMGGLVVYECFHEMIRRGIKKPCAIYFSGALPPDHLVKNRFSEDDEEKLVQDLCSLGGVEPEILKMPEFQEFFLPIIKNDIKIYQSYTFAKKEKAIDIPVTVLTGAQDDTRGTRVKGWERHTVHPPTFMEFSGNHFFLFDNAINYEEVFNMLIA